MLGKSPGSCPAHLSGAPASKFCCRIISLPVRLRSLDLIFNVSDRSVGSFSRDPPDHTILHPEGSFVPAVIHLHASKHSQGSMPSHALSYNLMQHLALNPLRSPTLNSCSAMHLIPCTALLPQSQVPAGSSSGNSNTHPPTMRTGKLPRSRRCPQIRCLILHRPVP